MSTFYDVEYAVPHFRSLPPYLYRVQPAESETMVHPDGCFEALRHVPSEDYAWVRTCLLEALRYPTPFIFVWGNEGTLQES